MVGGVRDNAILLRVAAPPVDDAANETLAEFLADLLHLPRRSIRIVAGERSRLKRVAIDSIAPHELRAALKSQP